MDHQQLLILVAEAAVVHFLEAVELGKAVMADQALSSLRI